MFTPLRTHVRSPLNQFAKIRVIHVKLPLPRLRSLSFLLLKLSKTKNYQTNPFCDLELSCNHNDLCG